MTVKTLHYSYNVPTMIDQFGLNKLILSCSKSVHWSWSAEARVQSRYVLQ